MKPFFLSCVKRAKRPSNYRNHMKRKRIYFTWLLVILSGCAYYNTMFNAEDRFEQANKKLESSAERVVTNDIKTDYNTVIDKCWKLINIYGEENSYADDALLLIGKCYFQMEDFVKAERFIKQFTLKYPDSDLILEGYLWLGRAQINLDIEDEARNNLNKIIADDSDDDFIAIAWFSLGELEQKNGVSKTAIENYQKCVTFTGDEILAARSLFAIGEILQESEEYDEAIDYYEDATGYDISDEFAFEIQMQKIAAMLKMEDPEAAISVLYDMQRNVRYTSKISLIEARLGDCFRLEDDYEDAADQYQYVLNTYPRTAGSANAAYGLAQIMETEYADLDSAKNLYERVKQEDRNAQYIKQAGVRAALITQYLALKSNIRVDREELYTLQNMDTTKEVTDSTEVEQTAAKKATPKLRSESQILASLTKNKFLLAEYFLLTMQNYDSALASYSDFAETVQDSILTPKAMYSLAYIYKFHFADSVKAREINNEILTKYPDSPYAIYLLEQDGKKVLEESTTDDDYKEIFLQAEQDLSNNNYDDALESFLLIAEDDSGSIWAEKSRYAIAWTYENRLDSVNAAISAYELIVTEYPNTEYAKIAQNKIKPPPVEKPPVADSLAQADSTIAEQNIEEILQDSSATIKSTEDNKRLDRERFDQEIINNSNAEKSEEMEDTAKEDD